MEHKTHVSERKKKVVKELENLMKNKTVMVVSIKNLPASQFQEIRKKLREKAEIRVIKRNLVDFGLEHTKNEALIELMKYVEGDCAVLFSQEDAFELSGFLSDNKSPSKAKAGQVSPDEIKIEAGATELLPGPAITELSQAGLKVKVEGGKIAISEAKLFIKSGETITEQKAGILSKLNIIPFKIGLEPIAAYCDGKVYGNVKINKQEKLAELRNSFARALGFGVSIAYVSSETLTPILGRAAAHENALLKLIKSDNSESN
jgi:large subunit ribosomal protein L10